MEINSPSGTEASRKPMDVDPVETVSEAINRIRSSPELQAMLSSPITNDSVPFNEGEVERFFDSNLDKAIELYCR